MKERKTDAEFWCCVCFIVLLCKPGTPTDQQTVGERIIHTLRDARTGSNLCVFSVPPTMTAIAKSKSECANLCYNYRQSCQIFNFMKVLKRCEMFLTRPACTAVIPEWVSFTIIDGDIWNPASNDTNVALKQPASASSEYTDPYNYFLAGLSVDGNSDTNAFHSHCFHGNDGPGGPNWLAVDLGGLFWINYVAVTNRGDYAPQRLDNFLVGVTNTSTQVRAPVRGSYPLCGQYPGPAPLGARMVVVCSNNTPFARIVIVQQTANGVGMITICELEVYVFC